MTSHTYTGVWINYDQNSVNGATLTLSQRNASILIAFLGLFTSFVGGCFWAILTFLLYNIKATDGHIDSLHRQHQVILRNSETPAGASWELFLLPFNWKENAILREKHQVPKAHRSSLRLYFCRSWSLSVLALLIFLAWTVAGIFTSEASSAVKTDTLVRSNNCGTWRFQVSNTSVFGLTSKLLSDNIAAAAYVKRCYGNNATSLLCKSFVKQEIQFSNTTNAHCPFDSGWCWYNDSAALQLDTGFIDSHNDLGINAPPNNRVKYRRVSTCSVIPPYPNGNQSFITATNTSTGTVVRYWYGPIGTTPGTNWTFEYDKAKMTIPIGYELNVVSAKGNSTETGWKPIPMLNTSRVAGDITLIYLFSNDIRYSAPINDPFFTSHLHFKLPVDGYEFNLYSSDYYANVMGCVDQHQFCNPNRWNDSDVLSCTPLTGSYTLSSFLDVIGYNTEQFAAANRIQHILSYAGGLDSSIAGRDRVALQANEFVYGSALGSIQGPLPDNQWVIEVTNWFAVSLAKLQRAIVEFASGPVNLPSGAEVITPTADGWPIMCDAQKVANSGEYQNFSVLALSIIFGVGGAIILLSWTLEPCVSIWRAKRNPRSHKQLQWIQDNKLEVQRLPYRYKDNSQLEDGSNC